MPQRKSTPKGDTFIVNIKNSQNHTWQGTVKWVERQEEIPFRSAIELIKLMDSALEISDEENSGEYLKKW
nr:hypothetical protein [uncultured Blautia sp.]